MTDKLIDLLTKFDEMGYIPTTFTENAEQAAIDWKNRLVAAIEADNAALRERLDKAAISLFRVGDTVYVIEDGTVQPRKIIKFIVDKKGLWITISDGVGVFTVLYNEAARIYLTPEAAEKRLAELGGEKE